MIEVRNLTKSFDGRTVLHQIDAVFETGKTNLIIGQSGSGKAVLMKSHFTQVMTTISLSTLLLTSHSKKTERLTGKIS